MPQRDQTKQPAARTSLNNQLNTKLWAIATPRKRQGRASRYAHRRTAQANNQDKGSRHGQREMERQRDRETERQRDKETDRRAHACAHICASTHV
eukprot:7401414-Alexandrium_andersonii.AAC.1